MSLLEYNQDRLIIKEIHTMEAKEDAKVVIANLEMRYPQQKITLRLCIQISK